MKGGSKRGSRLWLAALSLVKYAVWSYFVENTDSFARFGVCIKVENESVELVNSPFPILNLAAYLLRVERGMLEVLLKQAKRLFCLLLDVIWHLRKSAMEVPRTAILHTCSSYGCSSGDSSREPMNSSIDAKSL